MAAPGWRTDRSLKQQLFENGYEFEFFQAVRLLARIYSGRKHLGGTGRPGEEIVRFGARLSMAFPPSVIHDIERQPDEGAPVLMTVAFLGLTGTQGVLPFHYTERLIARQLEKDSAFADFLDIFNHRLLSLFYRAWEKHRRTVLYDTAIVRNKPPDPFTFQLLNFIGLGTDGLRDRMGVLDEGLLLYAGLIGQRPVSASALRGILRDYFGVPVKVEQNLGSWYTLEEADCSYMSEESERNQLGEGAVIGDEVWDQQARFQVCLGPLGFERFYEFLPGSEALRRLHELTRFLVGQALIFDVQVTLKADEVPYCRLQDDSEQAPRLGWMGWLKTEPFTRHADDTVIRYVN